MASGQSLSLPLAPPFRWPRGRHFASQQSVRLLTAPRTWSSAGHGLTGGVGRCYNFFMDFSECMAKAGDPIE